MSPKYFNISDFKYGVRIENSISRSSCANTIHAWVSRGCRAFCASAQVSGETSRISSSGDTGLLTHYKPIAF